MKKSVRLIGDFKNNDSTRVTCHDNATQGTERRERKNVRIIPFYKPAVTSGTIYRKIFEKSFEMATRIFGNSLGMPWHLFWRPEATPYIFTSLKIFTVTLL